MSITRAVAQSAVLARSEGDVKATLRLLNAAGYAPSEVDVTAVLEWPFDEALRAMGISPAIPGATDDADFAGVADSDFGKLVAITTLNLKRNLRGNISAAIDVEQGPQSQKLSQFKAALDREIERLEAAYLVSSLARPRRVIAGSMVSASQSLAAIQTHLPPEYRG